mmetsp:Transcript_39062/g.73286  ORF Transcript_39062/g.73286 Transcript_39062/m.73286 type:complete len:225 (-) Transcript_39062:341-1015(-)
MALRSMAELLMVIAITARSATAITIEQQPAYQSCLATPSTCTSLNLAIAQMTGTIPSELGLLTNLGTLAIWHNQLTGTIPSELGYLTRLGFLSTWENQLTGTIPTDLATLTLLYAMHLGRNQMTGPLPSEFAALTGVNDMLLCNNSGLCGDVPPGVPLHARAPHCTTATLGTRLGSACPTSSPTAPLSQDCCSVMMQETVFSCMLESAGLQQSEIPDSWCLKAC